MAHSGDHAGGSDVARRRSRVLRIATFALFVLIIGRLGWLQLARGTIYRELSEENYVQGFEVRAPRGLILDRNGITLADNRASLSITLSRVRDRNDDEVAGRLADLLDLPPSFVASKLQESRSRFYGSVVLLEDAEFDEVARIEEHRSELPGVKVVMTATRRYAQGDLATHAIGYVAEISDSELEEVEPLGYTQGDIVGKTGLEKRYELLLNGRDGAEYWVVDAAGREIYPFAGGLAREARPGHNLILTIDMPAQRTAERLLQQYEAGAIVGIEPGTGDVLVMASHPSPDPNAIVGGLGREDWNELLRSPRHPLLNRAVQATYPPGSPFKLITAGVGLEEGVITHSTEVVCKGAYKYGIRTFRCWKPEGHGLVDVLKGIVESCDVYMYQLGAKLGVATLMEWTERCGFGRTTGIDIGGEVAGNVPTPEWYDRNYGRRKWSRGVVLNLSIGQGELLVTPLQAACFVAGIVNAGIVPTPHLLKRVETYSGRVIGTARTGTFVRLPFREKTLAFLRRSMVDVVEAPNGTGKLSRLEGIEVAGKTGTAQNPHGEDHAWFVAYAPADDPEIVLAVLAENAGGGGAIAAPIAREVLRSYLRLPEPAPPALHTASPGPGETPDAVGDPAPSPPGRTAETDGAAGEMTETGDVPEPVAPAANGTGETEPLDG
ncbi:MAG: penicillin-binding protein 2 [Candidatus Eisenbacteria bacterium]|nr:penicillin-binding protein 2 [Candidatus Eisenbacteria bacterium]